MDFYVLKKVIKLAAIHFLRLSLLQARKNYHISQKGINAMKRIISIILIFVFSFMFSATAFAETGISGTCTYVDFYDSSSHGANNGNVGVSYSAYTIPAYHNCTLIIKIIENKAYGPSAYKVFETGYSNTFSGYHRFTGLPINTRMKTRFTKSNVAHPNQMRVSFEINPETAK